MRTDFPTREQLSAMPLIRLRNVDIREKDEEELVQEILSARLSVSPEVIKEVNIRVPDIRTKEEEEHWQKIIDEARMKARENVALQGQMQELPPAEEEIIEPEPAEPVEVLPVEGKKKGRPKKK